MKKLLYLTIALIMPILSACSDNDDEPMISSSELQGVWECTDCEVINIEGFNGLDLPESVLGIIENQLVNEMLGERITITDDVKISGNVIIFPDSGIKWRILEHSGNKMTVQYDTTSSTSDYGMNMTVVAKYIKIK